MPAPRLLRRAVKAAVVLAATVAAVVAATPTAHAADAPPIHAAVFTRGYDTTTRLVTLTMDADWYSPGDVPRVLQILRDNGVIAGFALTGRYVERFPEQARAIVAAGHKLVNHSYDHPYFTRLTREQRFAELDRAEAAYRAAGLSSEGWFRAPYRDGYADPGVTADLAAHGYWVEFDWTFDTTGYLGASQAVILDRVRRYTVPGATVLMHLSTESTDTAALPAVIATLRSMGYGFTDPYRTVTTGQIGAHYAALGAQRSALGPPRTGEMPGPLAGTAVQWFRTGRIYWRGDLGAHEVHGAIAGKYVAGRGGHVVPRDAGNRRDRHPRRHRALQPLRRGPRRLRLDLLDADDRRPRGARRDPQALGGAGLGARNARLPGRRRDRGDRRTGVGVPGWCRLLVGPDRPARGARRDPGPLPAARGQRECVGPARLRRAHRARWATQRLPARLPAVERGHRSRDAHDGLSAALRGLPHQALHVAQLRLPHFVGFPG